MFRLRTMSTGLLKDKKRCVTMENWKLWHISQLTAEFVETQENTTKRVEEAGEWLEELRGWASG